MKMVKVSDKGQISVPQEVRSIMKINKGDELVLIQDKGLIMLQKSSEASKAFSENFQDIKKLTEKSLKKVWDNKEDEAWNTYLKK